MKNFFQKKQYLYGLSDKPERLWFFIFFFILACLLAAGTIGALLFLNAAKSAEQTATSPKTAEKKTEQFNKSGFEEAINFISVKKEKFEKAKNSSFFPEPSL